MSTASPRSKQRTSFGTAKKKRRSSGLTVSSPRIIKKWSSAKKRSPTTAVYNTDTDEDDGDKSNDDGVAYDPKHINWHHCYGSNG